MATNTGITTKDVNLSVNGGCVTATSVVKVNPEDKRKDLASIPFRTQVQRTCFPPPPPWGKQHGVGSLARCIRFNKTRRINTVSKEVWLVRYPKEYKIKSIVLSRAGLFPPPLTIQHYRTYPFISKFGQAISYDADDDGGPNTHVADLKWVFLIGNRLSGSMDWRFYLDNHDNKYWRFSQNFHISLPGHPVYSCPMKRCGSLWRHSQKPQRHGWNQSRGEYHLYNITHAVRAPGAQVFLPHSVKVTGHVSLSYNSIFALAQNSTTISRSWFLIRIQKKHNHPTIEKKKTPV